MKCLSFNLWNINEPVDERMKNLSNFIMTEQPEIICFQEVSPYLGKIQVSDLLLSAGYHFVYRKSGVWNGREEGLVIATRFQFYDSGFKYIPSQFSFNDMQRILLYATIQYGEKSVRIYNTHLPYHIQSTKSREIHLKFIREVIEQYNNNHPFLLCGDFNTFPNENLIERYLLKGLQLKDTWIGTEEGSFSLLNPYVSPELWPGRRVDYIFADKHFTMSAKLCMTGIDGYAICSDHYGILACGEVN